MQTNSPFTSDSTYKHLLQGVLWAIGMRWSVRGIGLLSIVILARLLTPADFGIVAMGSLVLGLPQVFSDVGSTLLLIRESHVSREQCDTAWTMQLLQRGFVALVMVLSAHPAAFYFEEPRLVTVIYLLAVSALIEGAENVGMVLVRKELDFAKDFRFGVYKRLIVLVVTLIFGFVLRNYWALVTGQIVGNIFQVLLSYHMHSYRPRLSLARAREFLAFSLSIIPFNVGEFLNNKIDVIVVGGLGNTTQLGAYNLASELSLMLTREIVFPMGRGLYPNYARLVYDLPQLTRVFCHVLSAACMICLPLGFGMVVVAADFVTVFLGRQWELAIPLIQWLAIYATFTSLLHFMSGNILIVTGHEQRSSVLKWAQLVVLIPLVILGRRWRGAEGVAMTVTVSAVIVVPLVVHYLLKSIPLSLGQLLATLWRPVLAVSIMVGTVSGLPLHKLFNPPYTLVLDVVIGATVYTASLLGLWLAAGQPTGPERIIVNFIATRVGYRQPAL